ncbi:MAG: preprotein translocase subunit SecE [Planctomycetes bacterium]|nr:preprotein translocase subunit SecE [Planctomycetota bacterium]
MSFFKIHAKGQAKVTRSLALYATLGMLLWAAYRFQYFLLGRSNFFHQTIWPSDIAGVKTTLALIFSLVLFIGGAGLLFKWLNREKPAQLLIDTEKEMRNVKWPEYEEVYNSSLVVLVFIVILIFYLLIVDFVLDGLTGDSWIVSLKLYRGD